MTFLTRSAPSKTWSAPNKPSGFYVATVTRVENGNEVYVEVPRLTYEFEHGPIVYSGMPLSVGDKTWIGFLEGRQDDVVAPFPGGGGPLLIPDTIEVTLLIASTTSSSGMQEQANFLCNGTNDEVQFLAAANAVQASTSKVGRVAVAEGTYTFDDRLFKAGGGVGFDVEFVGMGVDATLLIGDHVGELDNGVIEWFEQGNLAFRNLRFDAFEFDGGDLAPYLIYKDGDGTGSLTLDNVQMNSDQGSLVWTDEAFYSRRLKGYSQNGVGLTTRNKVWLEGADIEANGPCLDFNTNIVTESAVRVTRSRLLATQTTAILGNNLSLSSTTIDSNIIETTSPSPCIDLKTGWVLNNRLIAANSTTGALHFASASGSAVIWVTGNDIDNGTQPGIKFLDGRYSIIDDNFLRAWGGVGIDIDRVIVSDSESFIVTDNKFANVAAGTGPGIRINDTSFAVVADNQFYSFDDTAVRVQGGSETALISRNLIVGSVPNGIDKIHIDQSDDVVVDRNHIVEGGIHIEDSNYAQVTNNVQEGAHTPTESYNIKLSGTTERATVQRNIYTGTRLGGGETTIEDGVLIEAGVTETKIRDNELSYAQLRVTDNGSSTLDVGLIPVRIEDRSATLTTGSGAQPVPWIGTAEIESVRATVGTSPTGSDEVIVDVNVNGSTLWTAQGNQPAITPAGTDSGLVFPEQNAILSDGDIITVDIDQVGDGTAGGYLTVTIYIREI